MEPSVAPGPAPVDYGDLQGLVRFGHGKLTEACFFLLEVADRDAACRWLQNAPVTSAEKADPRPTTALQVAFTWQGLQALGVADEVVASFSDEFLEGMAGEPSRSRRLGDVGANAPEHWDWGAPTGEPHLLVMVYAEQGGLEAWQQAIKGADWDQAFRVQAILPTFDMGPIEPFGFADGVSQPQLDWERTLPGAKERADYVNLIALGEVVLGYPNEYGRYTARPLIDPMRDPRAADLPPAEEVPDRRDLGRNGTLSGAPPAASGRRGLLAVPRRAGRRRCRGARAPGRGHGRPHAPRRAAGAAHPRLDRGRRYGPRGGRARTTSPMPAIRTASAARSAPMSGAPTRAPATCRPARRAGGAACCACSGSSAPRSATT